LARQSKTYNRPHVITEQLSVISYIRLFAQFVVLLVNHSFIRAIRCTCSVNRVQLLIKLVLENGPVKANIRLTKNLPTKGEQSPATNLPTKGEQSPTTNRPTKGEQSPATNLPTKGEQSPTTNRPTKGE
jgi:hypothetical protein